MKQYMVWRSKIGARYETFLWRYYIGGRYKLIQSTTMLHLQHPEFIMTFIDAALSNSIIQTDSYEEAVEVYLLEMV